MNKKADLHLAEVLRDLIIGAIILLIIFIPTVYLIKSFYGKEECPNKEDFRALVNVMTDIKDLKIQEFKDFLFFNKDCFIVTFTQDANYNIIKPPENKFTSPFICLCKISNDKCNLDSPELCTGLTTFDKVGGNQFTTKGLDKYVTLSLKREDKNLLINTEASQYPTAEQEDSTIDKTEPNEISDINSAMEYAKTHEIEKRTCDCKDTCSDYINWIIKYSEEFGPKDDQLDPILVLSILMQESSCRPKGCKWDNGQYSCGLMQVNKEDFTKRGENPLDPETQIKAGIRHLRGKYDSKKDKELSCYLHRTKWEKAVHAYNGWLCSNLYYIKEVKSRYETLKNPPQPLITAQK